MTSGSQRRKQGCQAASFVTILVAVIVLKPCDWPECVCCFSSTWLRLLLKKHFSPSFPPWCVQTAKKDYLTDCAECTLNAWTRRTFLRDVLLSAVILIHALGNCSNVWRVCSAPVGSPGVPLPKCSVGKPLVESPSNVLFMRPAHKLVENPQRYLRLQTWLCHPNSFHRFISLFKKQISLVIISQGA